MGIIDPLRRFYWLVYQAPALAFGDNRAWFESMADQYRRNTPWTRLRLKQVQRLVNPGPGDLLLDLGCGCGAISHFCASRGSRVTGVDSSPVALEYAAGLCAGLDCRFVQADVSQLADLDDASFDKSVAADLIEHVPDDVFRGMLAESFRILRPGGSLSIYTPNRRHLFERMKAHDFILRQHASHVAVRSLPEILRELANAGFSIDLAYVVASHFPVFNLVEDVLKSWPVVGPLFSYRLCVRAVK